jgi:hypothetical protein
MPRWRMVAAQHERRARRRPMGDSSGCSPCEASPRSASLKSCSSPGSSAPAPSEAVPRDLPVGGGRARPCPAPVATLVRNKGAQGGRETHAEDTSRDVSELVKKIVVFPFLGSPHDFF